MIYTITFNPSLDYVLHVKGLGANDVTRASSAVVYCGGKGINVSVVLKRLGVENTALGFAAGFTGDKLTELMDAEGLKHDLIFLKSGDTRINVKIKAEKELDINAEGPFIDPESLGKLFEKLENTQSGDYVIISGSVPGSLPDDIYETILEMQSGKGVKCIVDASGELLMKSLKYEPFLIKPNHYELGALFGVKTETEDEIIKYAHKLRKAGARNVLVSRSADGAVLADENNVTYSVGAISGNAVNTVGCGDSMVAGFVAGYIKYQDYHSALLLGAAAGNATAFSEWLANAEEIYGILKAIKDK